MSRRPGPPAHAVPVGVPLVGPDGHEHRADSRCSCSPAQYRDLGQPDQLIYVHGWAGDGRLSPPTGHDVGRQAVDRSDAPVVPIAAPVGPPSKEAPRA